MRYQRNKSPGAGLIKEGRVVIYMHPTLAAKLRAYAKANGRSVSAVVAETVGVLVGGARARPKAGRRSGR